MLRKQPVLSVQELTELLDVSHMTVRRDIAVLEREGRAVSVPGGVRLASQLRIEPSFVDKSAADMPQKRAIASVAASMIQEDMSVYLDAGTTVSAMVPFLSEFKRLTLLTNDFTTVNALLGFERFEVLHVGGLVDHRNRSSVGRLAATMIRHLNVDLAFISASAWDLHRGVTMRSESKVEVKEAAMEVSTRSVLLAGSAKYGTFALHRVAQLRDFDQIVTDEDVPAAAAEGIRDLGIDLMLADLETPAQQPDEIQAGA